MSEAAERKSDNSFWVIFVGVIAHNVLARVLGLWLSEPFAQGLATWLTLLAAYRFLRLKKTSFKTWAAGSLLFVVGFTSIIYGLSYLLCPSLGAAVTWACVGFLTIIFAWLFLGKLYRVQPGFKAWHWLLLSAAVACVSALLASWSPEGFCGGY